jgi:branched-chain amino acid transport system ATP-binding protein
VGRCGCWKVDRTATVPEPLLRTERLSRYYGGVRALTDVDFRIEPGVLHSVIGPNGAGKSTLFHVITGRVSPTSGRIWFRGMEITRRSQAAIARLGIARSYQITTVFPKLTVHENTRVAAQARTRHTNFWQSANALKAVSERADAALELVGLKERGSRLAGELSHGEQRHLDIAIALATDPGLLLLDEPTAGMSPHETEQMMYLIRDLGRHVGVVLVEHKMDVVLGVSDRITVLHFGSVLMEGTPDEVRSDRRVQEVYLEGSI